MTEDKTKEIRKFAKNNYDPEKILNDAEILKYSNGIKNYLNRQLENPDDEFVKIIAKEIYDGRLVQNKIDEFKIIFKDTFKTFINDYARKKFERVLENSAKETTEITEIIEEETENDNNEIITTEAEMESYFIIKSILGKYTDLDNITFKDTRSYFGVLFQNNTRKWICRMFIGEEKTNISFPTEERRDGGAIKEEKIKLESLKDLYKYEDKLVEVLKKYIEVQ